MLFPSTAWNMLHEVLQLLALDFCNDAIRFIPVPLLVRASARQDLLVSHFRKNMMSFFCTTGC